MTLLAVAVLALAITLGLAGPALAVHYLHRLPYAPACPHCSGITEARGGASATDRLWARLAATAPRRCEQCGWSGRMRWRLAPGRTGAGRGGP